MGDEIRNMCSCSQVIEERGIEKGILIYRTLLETKSIQQTVAKTWSMEIKRILAKGNIWMPEGFYIIMCGRF